MFIPSLKEILIMVLVVVLIGTPITWAIEDNQVKNMNIEKMKNELIERTGITQRELGGKSGKEIGDIFNSLIESNTKLHQIKDLLSEFNEKEIENVDKNLASILVDVNAEASIMVYDYFNEIVPSGVDNYTNWFFKPVGEINGLGHDFKSIVRNIASSIKGKL